MANLPPVAAEVARERYGVAAALLSQYVDILTTKGIDRGLLGPREADRVWERHILNCAAITDLIAVGSSVVDVGSGAGLPGIPLALLRPDLRMTLLEPLLRRFTFLVETVNDLNLAERISVVRARAEDHMARYDVVVARAVAPLDRLVTWCDPLRCPGGVLLALKGQDATLEVERARRVLRQHRLNAEVVAASLDPRVEAVSVVRVTDA
jgi:16S rRNA (guanine527-N7)-methyltransferase